MKKTLALLLIIACLLGVWGCAPQQQTSEPSTTVPAETTPQVAVTDAPEGSFAPGTYTGSAQGMYSTIIVEVTLDESAITDVEVVSQNDTLQIAAAAVNEMPGKILAAQSVGVDTTTGATMTSFAILNATRSALEEAGALDAFSAKVEPAQKNEAAAESFDVVVVGGGGSGLSAAAYAAQNGASVLVLEKVAYTGGSTALSGGGMIIGGSRYNEAIGYDYTPEEFVQYYVNIANSRKDRPEDMWINESLIEKVGAISGKTFEEFIDAGLPMPEGWQEGPWAAVPEHHLLSLGKGHMVTESWAEGRGLVSFGNFTLPAPLGAGRFFSEWLTSFTKSNGAEVRVNSAVTELVIESGTVTGVKVEDEEKTYVVNAKKVILACGGMEQNAELVKEYAPEIAGAQVAACPGNTGDFLSLTKSLNPVLTGYGSAAQVGVDARYEANTPYGAVSLAGLSIWVNKEGNRFVNETGHYYDLARDLKQQTDAMAWGIADKNNPNIAVIEQAVAEGINYKADTLEELAELIKVPADKLISAVNLFNEEREAGKDDSAYGVTNERMMPVLEAPFYAQPVRPVLMFTLTGLQANDNCQLLNQSGEIIPNLYGTGEVVFANTFFENYIAGGSAIQNAIMTGRIAGEHAVQEII
ncbi:MAG: FAD-dependent oxidoreductase [Clostridiales bacterium]|nr:FAD-dependent oxidoreductase [Clostridiales bacterium]